jgi:hypothetical protein
MAETVTFNLAYTTDLGKTMSLSIPRADDSMTAAQIHTAMSNLLGIGVLQDVNGDAQSVKGAKKITKDVIKMM